VRHLDPKGVMTPREWVGRAAGASGSGSAWQTPSDTVVSGSTTGPPPWATEGRTDRIAELPPQAVGLGSRIYPGGGRVSVAWRMPPVAHGVQPRAGPAVERFCERRDRGRCCGAAVRAAGHLLHRMHSPPRICNDALESRCRSVRRPSFPVQTGCRLAGTVAEHVQPLGAGWRHRRRCTRTNSENSGAKPGRNQRWLARQRPGGP
jgi:hypothetical protein